MKIAIHEKRFIREASLVNEEGSYSWKSHVPLDAYVIGHSSSPLSIDPVFEILEKPVPNLISEKNVKAFEILGADPLNLPIDAVQSAQEMIGHAKNCFLESRMALEEIDSWGYLDTLMNNHRTLKRLQRAAIDIDRLQHAFKSGKIKNKSVLKNFKPRRDGLLDIPVYSLTNTLTGRMTITSGPQILTAPKFVRNYLKSTFEDGTIVQVDFVSLEPRVAIQSQGQNLREDVYEHIGKSIFGDRISRRAVKKLVLCAIYGASEATLRKDIPDGFNLSKAIKETKRILNFDKIVKVQKSNYRKSGKIYNYFGRPITPQDSRDSLLYNNYVQSTAVDVALTGFSKIIDSDMSGVRPIFFIHDALILDIRKDSLEQFKKLSSSIHIDNMGDFPLDFQVLS